jgi:hypothetical protein
MVPELLDRINERHPRLLVREEKQLWGKMFVMLDPLMRLMGLE